MCWGGTLSYLDVAGRLLPVEHAGGSSPVGPVNPAGPDSPVVAGGPIGPRCPHLTVTLLARLARMLQGAMLAQMER